MTTPADLTAAHRQFGKDERRYRALIDALPQIVGILDAKAIVRYGNRQWCAYTGTPVDEHGLPHPRLLVQADDVGATAAILAAIEAKCDARCEVQIRSADGSFRRHEVRLVPLDVGGESPDQWMFTSADVEAQRTTLPGLQVLTKRVAQSAESDRATAARLREKTRLMAIVEQMAHVGHWRLDVSSTDLYWSDDLYKTFGLPTTYKPTLESTIARYHPDDRVSMSASLEDAISEALPFTREARLVRPDGTLRDVVVYGQPECASDGTVVAVVGCLQDVTATKVAQRERDRLSERVNVATQAAQVGIWAWDIRSGAVEWDSA